MNELKPCPFCGGEAIIITGEECAYVQCQEVKMHKALWYDGDNAAADEVAEQWNRRADLPPTLSAAMELPEVRALVDAATALFVQVDGLIPIKHPQQKLERNKLRHAIAALAAIKEPKI